MDLKEFMTEKIRKEFSDSGIPCICGCRETRAVYIPMRDGVRLHTWLLFPEKEQNAYPVILTRTCYPHNDFMYRIQGEELARRGYVFIWQYARGREKSEGEWTPNVFERNDGIDTVDWIVQQPWCSVLGYWGMSYTSMTGWAMADAVEGKVASMYLEHYGTDRFVSAYEKGCFRHDVLTSWSMENGPADTDCSYEQYIKSCRYLPQMEVDEALWGCRNETYREYISSPDFCAPLWQSGWWKTLREIPAKTTLPICLVSGWYDHHHGSTMRTWERLSETAKAHSRLVIGAWNHFMAPVIPGRETANLHPEEIPPMLQWFEQTLKLKQKPERAVLRYMIGEDRWEESRTWQLSAGSSPVKSWYLYGTDSEKEQTGVLLEERRFKDSRLPTTETHYLYDPENPAPSVGGEGLLKTMEQAGSLPQPEPDWRPDVRSFLSAPLEKALRIFGKIGVSLYIRSDCEDTAFTAKLMDVMPDGTAYHIRSSITTVAQSLPEGAVYLPGDAAEATLSMWEIAYTVKAGHRLRLDISSSDFPQFHIHSNYPGLWSEQTRTRTARQSILTGEDAPSRIWMEVHPQEMQADVPEGWER